MSDKFSLYYLFQIDLLYPIPITTITIQKLIILTWAQKFLVIASLSFGEKVPQFSAQWIKTKLFSMAFKFSPSELPTYLLHLVSYHCHPCSYPADQLITMFPEHMCFSPQATVQLAPLLHLSTWESDPAKLISNITSPRGGTSVPTLLHPLS